MQILVPVVLLAFVLGIAIQRGTTCAVLAVEELMRHRRADRFLGFFECGLWAALALILIGAEPAAIRPWSPFVSLLGGACLFGIGAAINGACAFGTIARLGNGRLEYLLTGLAAWAGIRAVSLLERTGASDPTPLATGGLTPLVAAALLVAVMLLRWRVRQRMFRSFVTLGALMAVIGVVGAVLGAIHQPWPWMNTLTVIPDIGVAGTMGLVALVVGAAASAIVSGQFRIAAPSIPEILRRLGGGALMGVGTTLVPGGNDALILYGVPQGDIRAIGAYLAMLATIAVALTLTRGVSPPWRTRGT